MIITVESVIELSKLIGALGIILGVIIGFVKWLSKQEKQTSDIKELKDHHDEDLKTVQEELCVVNYAVLASLDALIQNGYNGMVTEAREKLQKHINKKAHGQDGG